MTKFKRTLYRSIRILYKKSNRGTINMYILINAYYYVRLYALFKCTYLALECYFDCAAQCEDVSYKDCKVPQQGSDKPEVLPTWQVGLVWVFVVCLIESFHEVFYSLRNETESLAIIFSAIKSRAYMLFFINCIAVFYRWNMSISNEEVTLSRY